VIYVVRYLLITLYTIFWGSAACVMAFVDRSGESIIWIGRRWIRWILGACGIRIVSEGCENIDPSQPYVFMSNHQSVVDIGAIVSTIPVSFRFVAKRELTWIPFFGWALAASDHVIIDRGDREKAVRSLRRAGERIRRGTNVIIYPEGTRSATGELRDFKSGGFHLALEAQVPILPVTVSGSRKITPKRSLRVESGVVKIVYGKPIPTEGLGIEDRKALKEQVRKAILQGYDPDLQDPA
jgi:1-acyl-sn-glycerol-3-phosphate acyltransferase